jgi:hypothetical protein
MAQFGTPGTAEIWVQKVPKGPLTRLFLVASRRSRKLTPTKPRMVPVPSPSRDLCKSTICGPNPTLGDMFSTSSRRPKNISGRLRPGRFFERTGLTAVVLCSCALRRANGSGACGRRPRCARQSFSQQSHHARIISNTIRRMASVLKLGPKRVPKRALFGAILGDTPDDPDTRASDTPRNATLGGRKMAAIAVQCDRLRSETVSVRFTTSCVRNGLCERSGGTLLAPRMAPMEVKVASADFGESRDRMRWKERRKNHNFAYPW